MLALGAPTIRVVDCGDYHMAIEGCHRLMAAAKLGLAPTLIVLPQDQLVDADSLDTDFFEGRSAGWMSIRTAPLSFEMHHNDKTMSNPERGPKTAKIVRHVLGLIGGFFALWGFGFLYAAVFAPTMIWADATWWLNAIMVGACWLITFAIWLRVL
jgi:hypothetical protein